MKKRVAAGFSVRVEYVDGDVDLIGCSRFELARCVFEEASAEVAGGVSSVVVTDAKGVVLLTASEGAGGVLAPRRDQAL